MGKVLQCAISHPIIAAGAEPHTESMVQARELILQAF